MQYKPMDPRRESRVDEAHSRIENFLSDVVAEFGEDDTSEALVGILVISKFFNATEIKRKLEAHDELDDMFAPEDYGTSEENDWDENIRAVDREINHMRVVDDLGGRFDE